jgi:hypothetical protein
LKPNQVKKVATAVVWCGLVCYAVTGLLIAMLLYHPPAHASRWLALIGSWLVATILIVAGNYVRVRAIRELKAHT